MATVTIDGLWPNVQPTETDTMTKTAKSLFGRLMESQERRAQYRVAMMYDARTLRAMGMDNATIQRLTGSVL